MAQFCVFYSHLVDDIISLISDNIPDKYVAWITTTEHILIQSAIIDDVDYTHRFTFMVNRKWNNDIFGILTSDICLLKRTARVVDVVYYVIGTNQRRQIQVDLIDDTLNGSRILFEEINMIII